MASSMKDFHLSLLDQTMLRMYVRHLLFFEIPDPRQLKNVVGALRAGFLATIIQLPFLAGTIRLSDAETGRLALKYPELISDELIDRIFTTSYCQTESPDLEYKNMEKAGFAPMTVWGDVFCPSLLKNHPGLDDEYAAGLISFTSGQPVPVLAAQATFIHGGLVLSVYSHHSAIDGTGTAKLYRIWSNHTQSHGSMPVPPMVPQPDETFGVDIDSQRHLFDDLADKSNVTDGLGIRYPGSPPGAPLLRKEPYKLISKIFVFPVATISDLANTLSSINQKRISSFIALVSLIWTTVTITRSSVLADKNIQKVKLGMAFDHRRNLDQHFQDTYLGNCVTGITASVPVSTVHLKNSDDPVDAKQLSHIAQEITETLSSITLNWIKPRLALFLRMPNSWQLRSDSDEKNGPDLFVISWMHIGSDCNWRIPGTTSENPAAIRKPQSHVEGLMHILPKLRSENESPVLEVLLCLEEGEMERVVRRLEGEKWTVRVIDA